MSTAVEKRAQGLQLTGAELWLDATRKTPQAFVSHAHSDHIARHTRVFATPATLALMTHRLGALEDPRPIAYGAPFTLGSVSLELLPAGHVLGSAQLRATREDGTRITFTGDLNTVPSLTAEPHAVAHCDTLILESTFGHPRYAFPPRAEVLGALERWVRTCLEAEVTPVLWAYPLGKSQEAVRFLQGQGLKLYAHASTHALCQLYAAHGVPLEVRCAEQGPPAPDEVVVFPPRQRPTLPPGRRMRTALLSGWAVEGPMAHRRLGADHAFALSDHADCAALIAYAQATGARRVLTHHGFARELAQALQEAGVDASPVGTREQLELPW